MSTSSLSLKTLLLCLATAVTFFSIGVVSGNLATTLSLRRQMLAYDELVDVLKDAMFKYGQCVVYLEHYRESLMAANEALVKVPDSIKERKKTSRKKHRKGKK